MALACDGDGARRVDGGGCGLLSDGALLVLVQDLVMLLRWRWCRVGGVVRDLLVGDVRGRGGWVCWWVW